LKLETSADEFEELEGTGIELMGNYEMLVHLAEMDTTN
jgi:hypothetical protein